MSSAGNPAELRRPFMVSAHATCLEMSLKEQLVDDVTQIVQRVRFVECAPQRLWGPGLISELAEATDRLSVKVADLKEKASANGR